MKNTDFATTLRAYAAICVLISHYFGVYWMRQPTVSEIIRAPSIEGLSLPTYLKWLHPAPIFDWGSFGVGVFFLVSGFVIPYSIERSTRSQFIIGRLFRIVPVYVVGFSISLLTIKLSTLYFGSQWPYSFKEIAIHYVPGIRDILWSVNIDGIIWTLEIEMKFYVICLIGFNAISERSTRFFIIPAAVFSVAFLLIWQIRSLELAGYRQIYVASLAMVHSSPYLIFMFIGSVSHYLYNEYISAEKAIFLSCSLFFGYLAILYNSPFHMQLNFAVNYGLAVLFFNFAASYPKLFSSSSIGDFFANISYPLYAVHGVAGYVALRILWELKIKAWLSLIIVTALSVIVSWVIHRIVEVPANRMGKKLARNYGKLNKAK